MVQAVSNKQIDLCCGVYFLSNFFKNEDPYKISQWGATEYDRKRYNPNLVIDQKYVDKFNKDNGRETKDEYHSRIRTSLINAIDSLKNKKSYYLAILNSIEVKQIGDIFLDLGFEVLVPETKNPTGSAITMYIYHLLPREKKAVTSVIKKKV